MSDYLQFACPHCGQMYRLTVERAAADAGQMFICRTCRGHFTLPDFAANPQAAEDDGDAADLAELAAALSSDPMAGAGAVQAPHAVQAKPDGSAAPPPPAAEAAQAGPAAQAQPALPLEYQPHTGRSWRLADVLAFRVLVTVPVVRVVFWIAAALVSLPGISVMASAFTSVPGGVYLGRLYVQSWAVNVALFAVGLGWMVVGVVVVRVICELLIVVFRIHETLREVRAALRAGALREEKAR